MKLVVDANVLFAGLIRDGVTAELLCNSRLELFVPQFVYEEYDLHQHEILEKTHRTNIAEFMERIRGILKITQPTAGYLQKAEGITPDAKDTQYIALALQLGCPVWSNDKRLKGCGVPVLTTAELLQKDEKQKPYK